MSATHDSSGEFSFTPLPPSAAADDLPLVSFESDLPLAELLQSNAVSWPSAAPPPRPETPDDTVLAGEQGLFLSGNVLMCACPDCSAPMTVRIWLMVADCWQCGASIELTEEQEREAQKLLAQQEQKRRAAAPRPNASPSPGANAAGVATAAVAGAANVAGGAAAPNARQAANVTRTTSPAAGEAAPSVARQASSPVASAAALAAAPRTAAGSTSTARLAPAPAQTAPAAKVPVKRPAGAPPARSATSAAATAAPVSLAVDDASLTEAYLRDLFRTLPAWLVSMIFHMVLVTLFGFITWERDDGQYITVSTFASRDPNAGGLTNAVHPEAELRFDLPVPKEADLTNEKTRAALVAANQDAKELRLVEAAAEQSLPDVNKVKSLATSSDPQSRMLALRDPRIRVEVALQEGGTTLTEAAVSRGLRWLALHQHGDGSWRLNDYPQGCDCGGHGNAHNHVAGTSLALLPFFGAGQTHQVGKFKDHVSLGLRFLLSQQGKDGDLRGDRGGGNTGMYAHGQSTIVLCEAFKMTGDEDLRVAAQKAVDFIVAAQYANGGWRYRPRGEDSSSRGDTSVLGWQLMALQSARAANLTVPESTLVLAQRYLDLVERKEEVPGFDDPCLLYRYAPGEGQFSPSMTAEAYLCRMYLGWDKSTRNNALPRGGRFLVQHHLPTHDNLNLYYVYYATQVMHHLGGQEWDRWNASTRDALIRTQETGGHAAGSWPTHLDQHANAGGRIYTTSLATCTLEVYYRHAPIFRQLNLNAR